MARTVGLDVGARRVGVAISDPSGMLARPVGVVRTPAFQPTGLDEVAGEIAKLVAEDDGVEALVLGLPRRLDGSPTEMTTLVQSFGARLQARTQLPVIFQDERLSSREAESRLAVRIKDWRLRKQRLDAAAAAVILQDFLDARSVAVSATTGDDSEL